MKEIDFSAFFKEYYPLLRAFCIARFSLASYDADDLASQAFGIQRLKYKASEPLRMERL